MVQTAFRWSGEVSAFSRVREGGPGRPSTLALAALGGAGILSGGIASSGDVGGAGAAMILIGVWLLTSLAFWMLVKAGLRDRTVTFIVDGNGARIQTSTRQRALDRRMRFVMRVVFWLTLRGGQWASWSPIISWKDIKGIDVDPESRQILVRGEAWDIRLICTAGNFAAVHAVTKRLWPGASNA